MRIDKLGGGQGGPPSLGNPRLPPIDRLGGGQGGSPSPRTPLQLSPEPAGKLAPLPARGNQGAPFAERPPRPFEAKPASALPPPKTDWLPSSERLRRAANPPQLGPASQQPLNLPKPSGSSLPKTPVPGIPKGLGGQLKAGLVGAAAGALADALFDRLLGPRDEFGNRYTPDFIREKSERQNSPTPDNPFGQPGQRLIVTVTWGDGVSGIWGEIDAPVSEFFGLQFQPDSSYGLWTFIYSNAQITRGRSVNQGANREGNPSFSFAVKQPDGSGLPIEAGPPAIEPLPWDSTPFVPFPTPEPFVFPDDFVPSQSSPSPDPQPFPLPQAIPFPFPSGLPSPSGLPFPFPGLPPWAEPSPSPLPDRSPGASPSPRPGNAPNPSPRSGSAPSGQPRTSLPQALPRGQSQPRINTQTGVLPQSPTPPTQPPTPDRCEDPCVQNLQDSLDSMDSRVDDSLQGLLDLLQQLMNALQPPVIPDYSSELADIKADLIHLLDEVAGAESVTMQFEDCEGAVQAIPVNGGRLRVLARLFQVLNQFDLRAQKVACSTQKISDRIYRILGGDNWFSDQNSRLPEYNSGVLASVEAWGEQQRLGTDAEGRQVKLLSLIDLIAAYSAVPYYKAGLQAFPADVPASLLSVSDGAPPVKIRDLASYLGWFIKQFDALAGLFPIEIEIEDTDPTQPGKQSKTIQLPNISEALAELYGLAISGATNADVAINFLMRLSAEVIATKNASLITQDYAKANASFLGYRGNPKKREIDYAFNPSKLGSLEEFLRESKGYIQGWEEDDRESVVGFLQRIVFAAGITKAAFFRNKDRMGILKKELDALMEKGSELSNQDWQKFLDLINNPASPFNQGENPDPQIKSRGSNP